MSDKIRTIVTFESSAFNTVEQKEYFINPGCFGDDVANWVAEQLRSKGHEAPEKPGQEDFGWYQNFKLLGVGYCFVIGYRPASQEEPGVWIGWLERQRGIIAPIFGRRKHGIDPAATRAIHEILAGSPQVCNISWHFESDFNARREELGARGPDQA